MKTILKKSTVLSLLSVFIISLIIPVFAHPGSLDENGGHYDRSTGEYHYHHGYSAHQHENGECPYDFKDNVDDDYTPNNNSSSNNHTYPDESITIEPTTKQVSASNGIREVEGFLILFLIIAFLVVFLYVLRGVSFLIETKKKNQQQADAIYIYNNERLSIFPLIKMRKIISARYDEINKNISQNKINIRKWNIQNVDLYLLSHHLPDDVELDSNFNIIYKEATQERPFGKYTLYCTFDELHFDFNCKGGMPHNSLKNKESYFSRFPLCKKCISKYKEMDIEDYFDPLCDKRRPIYSKKDLPDYFEPYWYELYQKFISDAKEANFELSSFRNPQNNDSYDTPSMDKLLAIFRNFPETYEEHIDEQMLQFLDERYSLIRQLKNNDIRAIIKDIPKNVYIDSDLSVEISQAHYSPIYGEYTTFLQNNILHRTKHFEGQYTEFASFTYKDEIRVRCKLCEDCWSEISTDKKDKILNPKWYDDLLILKQKIKRLDIKKREYTSKEATQPTASSLIAGYAAMIRWLKEKGYIEDTPKANTNDSYIVQNKTTTEHSYKLKREKVFKELISFSLSDLVGSLPDDIQLKDNFELDYTESNKKIYGRYTVYIEPKTFVIHRRDNCNPSKKNTRLSLDFSIGSKYSLCLDCWTEKQIESSANLFMPKWYSEYKKFMKNLKKYAFSVNRVMTSKQLRLAAQLITTDLIKWPSSIHINFSQMKKIYKSKSIKILSYNPETKKAEIQGSNGDVYTTSFSSCTCKDFSINNLPCKHIYKYATEYGGIDFSKYI